MGNPIVPIFLVFLVVGVLSALIARTWLRETLSRPAFQRVLGVLNGGFMTWIGIHLVLDQRIGSVYASIQAAIASLMFVLAFAVEYREPPEKPRTRFRTGHLLAMVTLFCLQLGVHQAIRRSLPPKAPPAPPAVPAFPPAGTFPPAGAGGLPPRPNLTPIPRPQPLSPPGVSP